MKYGFRAACNNEFTGLTFYCTPEERAAAGGVCQFTEGEQYLHFRLLDDMPLWGDVGYIFNAVILWFFITREYVILFISCFLFLLFFYADNSQAQCTDWDDSGLSYSCSVAHAKISS